MSRLVELNSGRSMPRLALGTYQYKQKCSLPTASEVSTSVYRAVCEAVQCGFRHIDTAYQYDNETEVGCAIAEMVQARRVVTRDQLFVVSKLPMVAMRPGCVQKYLQRSLKALRLDYLDLYLIHNPVGLEEIEGGDDGEDGGGDFDYFPLNSDGKLRLDLSTNMAAVWREMERMVVLGLVRDVGVSNFTADQCCRLLATARIPPAVLQVELHLYCQQRQLRRFCRRHGIVVAAYAPLGSPERLALCPSDDSGARARIPQPMHDPVVCRLAEQLDKSPAQILIAYLLQLGVAVVVKAFDVSHMTENFQAQTLRLSSSNMDALCALDKNEEGRSFRFKDQLPGYGDHPEAFI